MPETRIVSIIYGEGGYDPTKPNNNVIEEKTKEFSDEELYCIEIMQLSNDASHKIRNNLDNWGSLSSSEKREAVKDCLVCLVNLIRPKL